MANAKTVDAVEVEARIGASPETVFDFFIEPDKMIQWMGRSAELDPRPGGRFYCDINSEAIASGEYLELDRPNRVVFSWGWNGEDSVTPPGSSKVEVLLQPDGDGTHLRLIHHDLPNAESAEKHGHGWRHYMDRLAASAVGEDPGPDKFGE
ncbi:MAG TPA: SRPBCC domain-containing protein [Solirubrobacterales bacterium]|nr:SRPBCC domain-containing protein [Solirubrobacterales bacterium]